MGLAPAAHGANRTGRDVHGRRRRRLGRFLMAAMHAAGFANLPTSRRHRRRAGAEGRLHRRRGALRAAGQQAHAGGVRRAAVRTSRRSGRCCPRVRSSSASASSPRTLLARCSTGAAFGCRSRARRSSTASVVLDRRAARSCSARITRAARTQHRPADATDAQFRLRHRAILDRWLKIRKIVRGMTQAGRIHRFRRDLNSAEWPSRYS